MSKHTVDIIPSEFKIALVGAGNVATRLGLRLKDMGFEITGVCSRGESSKILAEKLNCARFQNPGQIPKDVDMVIIATSDASVSDVAKNIPEIRGIVAHTSGSIPLESLSCCHARAAVLYPLQTFSKDVDVNIGEVPFFIEATDPDTLNIVKAVALTLSPKVMEADSAIRSYLHVAGVLSSNFPIYLLEITRRVLGEVNLPLDTVKPLVEATISKAFSIGPEAAMTGPARRGDVSVIKKQLTSFPEGIDKQVYEVISTAILNEFHPELKL